MFRLVLLVATVALSACPAHSPVTIRALPTTLSSDAARLLSGCAMQTAEVDMLLTCEDGVVVGSHRQPASLEPVFIAIANDRAQSLGARVEWREETLLTDRTTHAVREGVFLAVDDDASKGALHGLSRDVDDQREDLWCIGQAEQRNRCRTLLAALLQQPIFAAPPVPTAHATRVPAMLLGRSLSLPTSCEVERQSKEAGQYRCEGVAIAWRVLVDMDEGVELADGLLASVPSEEAAPLACRLGYERSVCRGNVDVVVGTAFVDGTPVVASCLGTGESVLESVGCRHVLNGEW